MYYDKLLDAVKIVLLRGYWTHPQKYLYVRYTVYFKPEITAAEKYVKKFKCNLQKTQNLKNNPGIGPYLQDTYLFYSCLKDDEIFYWNK